MIILLVTDFSAFQLNELALETGLPLKAIAGWPAPSSGGFGKDAGGELEGPEPTTQTQRSLLALPWFWRQRDRKAKGSGSRELFIFGGLSKVSVEDCKLSFACVSIISIGAGK